MTPFGSARSWLFLLWLGGVGSLAAQTPVPLVSGEWPPLVSESLPDQGSFTVVVREAFRRMGMDVSVGFMPWRRGESFLEAGQFWGAFPYTPTPDREARFLFSDEISVSSSRFFIHRGGKVPGGFSWASFHDLRGYLVGGVRGYWYAEPFADAGVKVDFTATDDANFEKLARGRVDLILLNEAVGWNVIRRLFPQHLQDFEVLPGAVHPTSLRVMVSKKFPGAEELLHRFNRALGTLAADGTLARLLPPS